ncbi:DUF461 domain containing protein [Sulfitobacter noctilucae]|uniref:copper chaperone PCu(A)C n=1 Tax=Sulfitobacter noctilucae TaxID=1342302 RepID=UPI00046A6D2C|nr:copper chaperone PCu(A)C [Sulfitobacter noctilucae]KIN70435.1 DUF461 domain containing protein [Sulfitobacter noctilucae]
MKRFFVFGAVIAIAALVYFSTKPPQSTVTVTNAIATPMGTGGDVFMVSLEMHNSGDAVTLIGVTAPAADVSITNPGGAGPLVVPAMGQGLLAMDGAHLMLSAPQGSFAKGTYQPIALVFDDGSEVAARVIRPAGGDGMAEMHHGMMQGVDASPTPEISLPSPPAADNDGFEISLALKNFTFVRVADNAGHIAGEGHAHIYLNGLKLGRLYESSFTLGALLPGRYALRIALNTNDHRPYMNKDGPVDLVYDFEIE